MDDIQKIQDAAEKFSDMYNCDEYNEDGTLKSLLPVEEGVPERVLKCIVTDFENAYPPVKPPVPYLQVVFDRIMLEIMRGCTRGCRFCQAGMLYRPVRERSVDKLVEAVDRNYQNLCSGEVDQWGVELDRAWEIKKTFAGGVSTPEIDKMYDDAKVAGALGGKILGAGGGGFMLLYVPAEKQDAVRAALQEYKEVPFQFEAAGSQIIFID